MKKYLALVLVAVMLLSLVACGGDTTTDTSKDAVVSVDDTTPSTDETVSTGEASNPSSETETGSVTKVGSITDKTINIGSSGLYYSDASGKYGIMSFDGKNDTGAKYTYCDPMDENFIVTTTAPNSDISDVSALNCFGAVDVNGKEIIPMKYASIKELSDRFYMVFEVTGQTENKEEAIVYYTDDMFSIFAQDGDTMFKGVWYVYDANTGAKVDNVSGTKATNASAHGEVIKYTTDDGKTVNVNSKGVELPEGIDLFENGWYAVNDANGGTVYDSNANKQFDYSATDYVPMDSDGDYLVARFDGKFALMEKDGTIIAKDLTSWPDVAGELMLVGKKVCDLCGNAVIDGEYTYLYVEKTKGDRWLLKEGTKYTMIDKDGIVLYQGDENDNISVDQYTTFTARKTIDGSYYFYSFKDKDYTIKGYSIAPWLVQTESDDNRYDVVDTRTGEPVIIGDYVRFAYAQTPENDIYVYALEKNSVDIYLVK